MRGGRRNIEFSGTLVGWLFADLALVLMIVFASTSVTASTTTTTSSSTTSSTTTTTAEVTTTTGVEQGGVELQAIETEAIDIGDPVGSGVVEQLEQRLSEMSSSGSISMVPKQIGVILVYAGARTDGDVTRAKQRACLVRDALLREWDRIQSGRVYFKCFHDLKLENGLVEFSLFPILE